MHLSSQHQWQGAANLDDICASEGAQASKAGHCQVVLGLHQCLNLGEFKKKRERKNHCQVGLGLQQSPLPRWEERGEEQLWR